MTFSNELYNCCFHNKENQWHACMYNNADGHLEKVVLLNQFGDYPLADHWSPQAMAYNQQALLTHCQHLYKTNSILVR